ncbi:MAG: hypothetical protein RL211_1181 [Pseudomonadota bacterium]|jgi:hypothetical protein
MAKRNGAYQNIVVQSVMGRDSMGRPKLQIRPMEGQGLATTLNVECSKKLRDDYPVGTKFRIQAQLTDMDGTPFLYSYYGWPVEVLKP